MPCRTAAEFGGGTRNRVPAGSVRSLADAALAAAGTKSAAAARMPASANLGVLFLITSSSCESALTPSMRDRRREVNALSSG
jgi:hypothetical protein